MENISSCKNLLNVGCQDSIRSRIFPSCLKIKNHLGRNSPSHFLENVLTKTTIICFKNVWNFLTCALPFVFVIKFSRLKIHLKIYFSLFSLTIANRGGISVLKTCIDYEGYHSLRSPSFFDVIYFWGPFNFWMPYIRNIWQI